jgi:hypothetical protein
MVWSKYFPGNSEDNAWSSTSAAPTRIHGVVRGPGSGLPLLIFLPSSASLCYFTVQTKTDERKILHNNEQLAFNEKQSAQQYL